MPEQKPARAVKAAEKHEEADVEQPQCLPDRLHRRADARHLRQGERQDASAHGRGEPVGGELADHLLRVFELQKGANRASLLEVSGVVGRHLACSLMRSVNASAARVR
jgi:hypothetical protein